MIDKARCKHFTGMINPSCDAGHIYIEMRDDTKRFPNNFPCHGATMTTPCPHYQPHTDEEVAEIEKQIIQAIAGFNKFNRRETEDCPHCGDHVEQLEKIGRCTYARPCGCRIHQGDVPEAWQS